jgi:3-hydroxyisobutyrate dehydrogenase-like beta-hydroxyacid dehydrogenase
MDVVFSIVSTGKDLAEVYFGKDGVASGNGVPKISSTARPSGSRSPPTSARA